MGEGDETLGFLDRRAVARILDVAPSTITRYRSASHPGGIYEQHPFPEPDGYIGGRPIWRAERAAEIEAWEAARPGGGGGRRRKNGIPRPP